MQQYLQTLMLRGVNSTCKWESNATSYCHCNRAYKLWRWEKPTTQVYIMRRLNTTTSAVLNHLKCNRTYILWCSEESVAKAVVHVRRRCHNTFYSHYPFNTTVYLQPLIWEESKAHELWTLEDFLPQPRRFKPSCHYSSNSTHTLLRWDDVVFKRKWDYMPRGNCFFESSWLTSYMLTGYGSQEHMCRAAHSGAYEKTFTPWHAVSNYPVIATVYLPGSIWDDAVVEWTRLRMLEDQVMIIGFHNCGDDKKELTHFDVKMIVTTGSCELIQSPFWHLWTASILCLQPVNVEMT
jgi:hypothetical protein